MQEDNFLEYSIPEVKIKISHPATWKIVPAIGSILLATMFKQSEGSRPGVTISVHQIPPNIKNTPANGREYVEANMTDLKKSMTTLILLNQYRLHLEAILLIELPMIWAEPNISLLEQ